MLARFTEKEDPNTTTTPTKVLDFEEPAERPVNTGSTPSAQVNTVQEKKPCKEALATQFDYIQAKTKCRSKILAEKFQQNRRGKHISIEDLAKFLHDTIAAQRKFLAEQRLATFVAIGSEEDERAIKKMNEQAADKEKEQKAESVHEEVKEEEGAKKRKLGTRRKLKAKRRKYTSGLTRDDDDLKMCLHIAPGKINVIYDEIP
ncbi:hypothetical protein Tco_0693461 [Tanacetum coccineum]